MRGTESIKIELIGLGWGQGRETKARALRELRVKLINFLKRIEYADRETMRNVQISIRRDLDTEGLHSEDVERETIFEE